jgi:hypothetical protein
MHTNSVYGDLSWLTDALDRKKRQPQQATAVRSFMSTRTLLSRWTRLWFLDPVDTALPRRRQPHHRLFLVFRPLSSSPSPLPPSAVLPLLPLSFSASHFLFPLNLFFSFKFPMSQIPGRNCRVPVPLLPTPTSVAEAV